MFGGDACFALRVVVNVCNCRRVVLPLSNVVVVCCWVALFAVCCCPLLMIVVRCVLRIVV